MDPRIFGREFSCFGGVTREREEEEKGVNESLYIMWRTLMDHSFCNRSLHPSGDGSSSAKESEKKQHFLSLLIIREIWRGRSYKCDVIRAHGDYIPFGNVFLGRRQKCTQKRFR
jgi:hypothetical protein